MVAKTKRGKHCEQEIINAYLKIKERYGEIFPHIGREKIYDDVAEITDYTPHRIGIVVNEFTKGKIIIE
jgi:hypothetical protein